MVWGTVRRVLLILAFAISVIVLGVSASVENTAESFGVTYTFEQFEIAVSVISMVVIGAALVIDRTRRNSVPSWVGVEVVWLGVLWVLWLAAAAYTTNTLAPDDITCNADNYFVYYLTYFYTLAKALSLCRQLLAGEALSWLNWLILLGLFVLELSVAGSAHNRTNGQVWKSTFGSNVESAPGHAPGSAPVYPMQQPAGPAPGSAPVYPMQQPAQQQFAAPVSAPPAAQA